MKSLWTTLVKNVNEGMDKGDFDVQVLTSQTEFYIKIGI